MTDHRNIPTEKNMPEQKQSKSELEFYAAGVLFFILLVTAILLAVIIAGLLIAQVLQHS